MTTWDKEGVYDAEIAPLMDKIIEICRREDIPIVAKFQLGVSDVDGAYFCTTVVVKKPRACEEIMRLGAAALPRPVVLAEEHVTNPDGTKTIHIRRVT